MTKSQLVWGLAINLLASSLFVGLLLPLVRRLWAWMNRPSPLTPRDKGRLVEQIAMMEADLKKLNHYAEHAKDIFLLMIRLVVIDLFACVLFFYTVAVRPNTLGDLSSLATALSFMLATLTTTVIFYLSDRLSDQKINDQRAAVAGRIADAKRKLQAPINEHV
jgi:hypothetical protein